MRGRRALILLRDRFLAHDLQLQLEHLGCGVVEICETADQALHCVKTMAPDIALVGVHARGIVDAIEAAVMLSQLDIAVVLVLRTMPEVELQARLELEMRRHAVRRARSRAAPRARILVIEEDEPLRHLLADLLQEYEVVVSGGAQALRYLQAGERYDLIVGDLDTPVMSPMKFYRTLEKIDPEQARRVLIVTAGASTPGETELLETTTCRILEKPYDKTTLMKVVADELRRISRS